MALKADIERTHIAAFLGQSRLENESACQAGPAVASPMGGTPQRPGAAGGQLAPGWTEHTAPDGRKYWHNKASGKSVWEKPLADAATTPVPKARPQFEPT